MLPRQKAIYENFRVLDSSGRLLFRAGQKRLDWYLSRGLAKRIDPETIQLTFANKGDGRRNEPFYLQDMQNKCVVCGSSQALTQHHIVPYQYRQYMPEAIKSRSSYDLLPLCMKCHDTYERSAIKFKQHIAACFGAPLDGVGWEERPEIGRAGKAAAALLSRNDRIPNARLDQLKDIVRDVAASHCSLLSADSQAQLPDADAADLPDVLRELCELKARVRGPEFQDHGEIVVGMLADSQRCVRHVSGLQADVCRGSWRHDSGVAEALCRLRIAPVICPTTG
ncbi:hypothetical protein DL89DRAFT_222068 [Linderina pennispora]|uniref:HNH domain-containing protein n=1 Tax=Linderina pennispora TaxID=61395 RepID=A0A1Y1WDJ6_9FUNG|nr:uncharacterized protein DL89DRAFT_222068 [Linderina pennispora]ORX71522.1 hypothetical protein DL89DRAFT_222068 [Linderina pennispora]